MPGLAVIAISPAGKRSESPLPLSPKESNFSGSSRGSSLPAGAEVSRFRGGSFDKSLALPRSNWRNLRRAIRERGPRAMQIPAGVYSSFAVCLTALIRLNKQLRGLFMTLLKRFMRFRASGMSSTAPEKCPRSYETNCTRPDNFSRRGSHSFLANARNRRTVRNPILQARRTRVINSVSLRVAQDEFAS